MIVQIGWWIQRWWWDKLSLQYKGKWIVIITSCIKLVLSSLILEKLKPSVFLKVIIRSSFISFTKTQQSNKSISFQSQKYKISSRLITNWKTLMKNQDGVCQDKSTKCLKDKAKWLAKIAHGQPLAWLT